LLINQGNNSFELRPLPDEAQVSPIYGIAIEDLDGNGTNDLVLGGNLFAVKPEIGRYDALHGLVLLGNGKGDFEAMLASQSGLSVEGEVRHLSVIRKKSSKILGVARNNEAMVFYSIQK